MQKYIENYYCHYCWGGNNYMINLDIRTNNLTIHNNGCEQIHNNEKIRTHKYIFKSFEEYLLLKEIIPTNLIENGFWIQNLEKSQVILNDKPNRLYLEKLFDNYSEKQEKLNISFCKKCFETKKRS
jgi:hypothetical protein